MKSLRAGLVVYGLDRPSTGIGRYSRELAGNLAGVEPELELALLLAGGAGALATPGPAARTSLRGCRLLPGLVTWGNLALPLAARRLRLDVVHDPTGVTPFLFGAGGARTVVTVHDVFAWSCPGNSTRLDSLIYRHWLPHVLPRVGGVITPSQASKEDVIRYLEVPSQKVHRIYNGVPGAFKPAPAAEVERVRRQYRLPARYMLFVGSVEKRKNLVGLLQACAQLKQADRPVALVVAGPTTRKYPELFRTLGELGLEHVVVFAGYVPETDLPALYSGAVLFAFPSFHEGFGLPPLEAMACGTPVVCSDTSSLPEVVDDAALTVDPSDVDALAEALARLLNDAGLREELRQKGFARAGQFSWEKTARETVGVYRKVLGR